MPTGPFSIPTLALHLTSLSLFLLIVCQFWYLLARYKSSERPFPVRPTWLVLLVVLLGATLSYTLSFNRSVLAFEISVSLVLSLLDPVLAVSTLMGYLLMRPWELMPVHPIMMLLPRALAGMALLSWLFHAIARRSVRVYWNEILTCFVILVLWLLLSGLLAPTPVESARVWWESFFPILVVVFLVQNSITHDSQVRLLELTMVISVLCIALVALGLGVLDNLHGEYSFWSSDGRAQGAGMWSNANDLASLITIALPLVLVRRPTNLSLWRSVLMPVIGLILLVCLWLTQSRGAFLALGLGAVAYAIARSSRRAARFSVVLGALFFVALLFVSMSRGSEELGESSAARLNYLVTGIHMVLDRPVTGVGLGNYPRFYEQYSSEFHEWGERTAHSSWTLVMAESGFPGLLLFAAFFFLVFRRAWRMRGLFPELFVVLVCYGVAFSFLSHSYLLPPYALAALVMAASRVSRNEVQHEHA